MFCRNFYRMAGIEIFSDINEYQSTDALRAVSPEGIIHTVREIRIILSNGIKIFIINYIQYKEF